MLLSTIWLVISGAISILKTEKDANHCRRYYEAIPEDLWVEIFVRLSAESLLNVRCVCTLWYNVVNNETFVKKHLDFQKKRCTKKNERFLLKYATSVGRPRYMLFDANGKNLSSSSTILLDPCLHTQYTPRLCFLGPINGLYCVYGGRHNFVIWNPATEEVGFLPSVAELLPTTDYTNSLYSVAELLPTTDYTNSLYSPEDPLIICNASIGFGFDPLNEQDYKVLLICKYDRGMDDDEGFSRMLYTTSTDKWRLVDNDNGFVGSGDPRHYLSNNTYLNGFYYWWVTSEGVLLVFDMGQKENFHTVCGPDNLNLEKAVFCSEIVLHNDHISLIIVNDTPCEIDIWVLIDEESSIWTKNTCVRGVQGARRSLGFCGNNDDQLLLVVHDREVGDAAFGYKTVMYNTNTHKVEDVGPPGRVLSRVSIGYESLISLSSMGISTYTGNQWSSVDAISYFLYKRIL